MTNWTLGALFLFLFLCVGCSLAHVQTPQPQPPQPMLPNYADRDIEGLRESLTDFGEALKMFLLSLEDLR